MKKREFKPNTVELNLRDDIPLEQDITVAFWKDPSRQVVGDLLRIAFMPPDKMSELSEDEKQEYDDRYFECASLLFVDCDIKGIDFSTPESTKKAFDDERIPWGLFHQALLFYLDRLTEEYSALKNALRRVRRLSDSGEKSKTQENE